ncbi:MAG: hypothetical protein IPK19_11190 [Chloroflexi bacterium]|nr:hypothetical protein [Chloroflexota bacterium]
MKIVLTGIAATPYSREYISNAAATLRKSGHEVFVPHEATWTPPENPAAENGYDFEATYSALSDADLLMAILDGYTVDDAVAAQIGAFHVFARLGNKPRRMMGLLHDTRVAGWSWSGEDKALNPQIRQSIREFGAVYPNFYAALAALEKEG